MYLLDCIFRDLEIHLGPKIQKISQLFLIQVILVTPNCISLKYAEDVYIFWKDNSFILQLELKNLS